MRGALSRPKLTVRFLDCARNDKGAVFRPSYSTLLFRSTRPFCHFYRSIVFSLSLAQNRGFCAKEERQRSEVASRVYAACLERSLTRRAERRNPARSADKRGRPSHTVRFLDYARNDRALYFDRALGVRLQTLIFRRSLRGWTTATSTAKRTCPPNCTAPSSPVRLRLYATKHSTKLCRRGACRR